MSLYSEGVHVHEFTSSSGAAPTGDANHEQMPAGAEEVEGDGTSPLGLRGIEVEVALVDAIDGDGGDAAVGGPGEDIGQLAACKQKADLGARGIGEGNGMLVGLLESVASLPIAAQQDGRIEIVVDAGVSGHKGNQGKRGGGAASGLEAGDKEVVEGVFGDGALVEQVAQRQGARVAGDGGLAGDQVANLPLVQQGADSRHAWRAADLVQGVVLMPVIFVDVAAQPGDLAVLGEQHGGVRMGAVEPGDDVADGHCLAHVDGALGRRERSVEILVGPTGGGQKIDVDGG